MKPYFSLVFCCFAMALWAQNPISPPGVYLADPAAHLWNSDTLYVYGSIDESCDYYCSDTHHLLFTNDMKNWHIAENIFASAGENDALPYNDKPLYAPDCAMRNDSFFLYFCQPDPKNAEGVAFSLSPKGKFRNGQKMQLQEHQQIDPAVFIDDHGKAYYLWGQFSLKMAELKPNMRQIDTTTIRDSVLTESQHFFHEGAFLAKRNGTYYLVYADISREDKPTCIGYATAKQPFGPYTYGGVIIDNDGCNPRNWNNHGSIARFRGQWYVFYHRSTHGCNTMRKACAEPIRFAPDGSIAEVEMTSQGAAPPLDATRQTDAASACLLHGNLRIEAISKKNEALRKIHNGDRAIFKYLNFGKGIQNFTLRVKSLHGGKIVICIDKPWHKRIATIGIPPSGESPRWQTLSFETAAVSGTHALWLMFYGDKGELFEIDWFRFE